MARVLLVDDHPTERQDKRRALEANGHEVVAVDGSTTGDLFDECRIAIGDRRGVFDFLVFDVQVRENAFGGIQVYNKLVAHGLRHGWRHSVLSTKHVSDDIASATYEEAVDFPREFVIRVFVETAGIPYVNVFKSDFGGHRPMLARIADLLAQPLDKECRECGQSVEWR